MGGTVCIGVERLNVSLVVIRRQPTFCHETIPGVRKFLKRDWLTTGVRLDAPE